MSFAVFSGPLSVFSGQSVNFLLVFAEGLLSFFSPCIIPLLPVYMTYLAGNAKEERDGVIHYKQKKVFLHTVFFVLGISFAFFILLTAFTAVGSFFSRYQNVFTRVAGIIIILLGLHQLGVFEFKFLQRDRRVNTNFMNREMNPVVAFVMGFTFSFAWTPCIGPMLSSVLVLASTAKSPVIGLLLMLAYTLGFVIPFLLLGLFTTKILEFFGRKKNLLKYTIKVGGVIMIILGIMTFTGWMNNVSGYLNQITNDLINDRGDNGGAGVTDVDNGGENGSGVTDPGAVSPDAEVPLASGAVVDPEPSATEDATVIPSIDFTLTDQYGNIHKLSDYKGKVVFLNFWATWCPPCREEMPDIEKLYQEFGLNQDEVVFLGVAAPRSAENPYTNEVEKEGVIDFLNENNFTFPTVFDETGEVNYAYYIQALPTTYLVDKDGNLFGYYPGMMTESIMRASIADTIKSTD